MTVPLNHSQFPMQKALADLREDKSRQASSSPDREPSLTDHGCIERWEDEGGAVMAAGEDFSKPAAAEVKWKVKAVNWLQYAARKTPQSRVVPDFRQALTNIRRGSSLSGFSNRNGRLA